MKQTKLEKQIKEIAKRNFTIMGIPSRKGIKEILSLIETERKKAVEGFVKSEGKRIASDRKKLLLGFGKDKQFNEMIEKTVRKIPKDFKKRSGII